MSKKLFRLLVFALLIGIVIIFSGCGFLSKVEDTGEFLEDIEKVNELKEDYKDSVTAKISDEAEKTQFTADYFMVTSADTVASVYYAIVNFYNLTPKAVDANIVKEGDTYTITEDDGVVKFKYDKDSNSSRFESYENNVLTLIIESVELSEDSYAYQLYQKIDSNITVIQCLIDGEDGKLSVNTEATSTPSSIYKVSSVPSTFATSGTRVYKYENGTYTFTGSLDTGNDDPNPNKVASDLTIVSGLKTSYNLNEVFDITDITVRITYTDNTTTTMTATSSMVVGTLPDMSTTGSKSFVLKYQTIERTFNFTVVEGNLSDEEKLDLSFDNFYNTLILGSNSLYLNYTLRTEILTNPEILDFYTYEFNGQIAGVWSSLNLLSESIIAIKASHEGNLGTTIFPNPTGENYGKTAYCNYNSTTKTYTVGYWAPKQLNSLYWFESEVSFDASTDSVKAVIKAGVNESQLVRGHVEYTKISNGEYACMTYYPLDENDDEGKYNTMQFRFTATEGDIAQTIWVESKPTSIYMNTNVTNYAETGDKTLTLTASTITFINNLECPAEDFLYGFIRELDVNNNLVYEGSVEDDYLQRLSILAADYYFEPSTYSLDSSELDYNMYILSDYQNKVFAFNDYTNHTITVNGDTTTFVLDESGTVTTYIFKYTTNKLSLEVTGASKYLVELIKVNNKYYVQMIEEFDGTYYVYQNTFTDNNNMSCAYSELSTKPSSIYTTIPVNFGTTGSEVYTLVNGVVNYSGSEE